MSVHAFLLWLEQYPFWILVYFGFLVATGFALGVGYRNPASNRWRHIVASVVAHAVSLPGILSATALFYTMIVLRNNALQLNVVLYFVPGLSMVLTLWAISRYCALSALPGFERLSGFMLMMALISLCLLFLYRFHLVIGFFSSIESLLIAAVILYGLFQLAAKKISRSKSE
tara:strand:+ start:774 stop:1289 length:516 start_codon:yes stop_codon:yes gene_type:complete